MIRTFGVIVEAVDVVPKESMVSRSNTNFGI